MVDIISFKLRLINFVYIFLRNLESSFLLQQCQYHLFIWLHSEWAETVLRGSS